MRKFTIPIACVIYVALMFLNYQYSKSSKSQKKGNIFTTSTSCTNHGNDTSMKIVKPEFEVLQAP